MLREFARMLVQRPEQEQGREPGRASPVAAAEAEAQEQIRERVAGPERVVVQERERVQALELELGPELALVRVQGLLKLDPAQELWVVAGPGPAPQLVPELRPRPRTVLSF